MTSAFPHQHLHSLPALKGSTLSSHVQPQKRTRALTSVGSNVLTITKRESDILQQLCAGQTSQQMAETLGVKTTTIRTIIRSLFGKTRTSTRAALVWWWTTDRRGNSQQGKGKTGKKNRHKEKFEPVPSINSSLS